MVIPREGSQKFDGFCELFLAASVVDKDSGGFPPDLGVRTFLAVVFDFPNGRYQRARKLVQSSCPLPFNSCVTTTLSDEQMTITATAIAGANKHHLGDEIVTLEKTWVHHKYTGRYSFRGSIASR